MIVYDVRDRGDRDLAPGGWSLAGALRALEPPAEREQATGMSLRKGRVSP